MSLASQGEEGGFRNPRGSGAGHPAASGAEDNDAIMFSADVSPTVDKTACCGGYCSCLTAFGKSF